MPFYSHADGCSYRHLGIPVYFLAILTPIRRTTLRLKTEVASLSREI